MVEARVRPTGGQDPTVGGKDEESAAGPRFGAWVQSRRGRLGVAVVWALLAVLQTVQLFRAEDRAGQVLAGVQVVLALVLTTYWFRQWRHASAQKGRSGPG